MDNVINITNRLLKAAEAQAEELAQLYEQMHLECVGLSELAFDPDAAKIIDSNHLGPMGVQIKYTVKKLSRQWQEGIRKPTTYELIDETEEIVVFRRLILEKLLLH